MKKFYITTAVLIAILAAGIYGVSVLSDLRFDIQKSYIPAEEFVATYSEYLLDSESGEVQYGWAVVVTSHDIWGQTYENITVPYLTADVSPVGTAGSSHWMIGCGLLHVFIEHDGQYHGSDSRPLDEGTLYFALGENTAGTSTMVDCEGQNVSSLSLPYQTGYISLGEFQHETYRYSFSVSTLDSTLAPNETEQLKLVLITELYPFIGSEDYETICVEGIWDYQSNVS